MTGYLVQHYCKNWLMGLINYNIIDRVMEVKDSEGVIVIGEYL